MRKVAEKPQNVHTQKAKAETPEKLGCAERACVVLHTLVPRASPAPSPWHSRPPLPPPPACPERTPAVQSSPVQSSPVQSSPVQSRETLRRTGTTAQHTLVGLDTNIRRPERIGGRIESSRERSDGLLRS
eukprot:51496-Prorocentrum_minimum.AAC.1